MAPMEWTAPNVVTVAMLMVVIQPQGTAAAWQGGQVNDMNA